MPLSRLVLAWALAALLALAGCRGEPESPPETPATARDSVTAAPAEPVNPFAEPARRALRIELGLDGYRAIEGGGAAGGPASTFTAYFAGDTLRFIEERGSAGGVDASTNVYYFEGGALFYAVQDEAPVPPAEGEQTQRDASRLRIAFDARGDVIAAERAVNGAPGLVGEATVRAVRDHAAALRDRAHALREAVAEPTV